MRKSRIAAILLAFFLALGCIVVFKSDDIRLSFKAFSVETKIEGQSNRSSAADKSGIENGPVVDVKAASQGNTATSQGSQSPSFVINNGSAPVNINYAKPASNEN